MSSKRIFEIPIYPTCETAFYRKWTSFIENQSLEWLNGGWNIEDAQREIRSIYFPKTIWKYAQIIGYLTIDISKNEISFNVYLPLGKKHFPYNSSTKNFPQSLQPNDAHVYIEEKMTNRNIRAKILEMIEQIQKAHFPKYYLDLTVFQNVIDYIDFQKILFDF